MDKQAIDNSALEWALDHQEDVWPILKKTKVILPMRLDSPVANDPLGNAYLPPNAKVAPMTIEDKEGKSYFPLFTTYEQLRGLDQDSRVTAVYVDWTIVMQLVRQAGEQIEGIVLNPYQQAAIFDSLTLLRTEAKVEKVAPEAPKLRMPVKVNVDLEDVLVDFVKGDETARSVYLLERLVKNEASRYYVVVDGLKPEKIEWLANRCLPYCAGKQLEFSEKHSPLLFGLLNDFEPLYEKDL